MTALLSVTQSDTEKVALYVADCRRMGIDVKPPSVDVSGWDFTIKDSPEGKSTIRFGLGAVKNVGHGPVDSILEARKGRNFKDINDFARRVDLRSVGKRALESLIKVGALDLFGQRSALLSIMDQILSISSSHFRASDAGQISMFGAGSALSDEIILPRSAPEINRREILEWERELIGLYVSDHPLSPVMDALAQVVTHFSGQLSEASAGDKVRVAGIVTRVRPHTTKTGKSMGFVTLEDVQGTIELVVFPKTWEKNWQTFEVDAVVLVDGKVDAQSGDPKVLVDSVSTDLKTLASQGPAAISDQRSAVSNQPVKGSGQQLATGSQRAAISGQKSAISNQPKPEEQQAVESKQTKPEEQSSAQEDENEGWPEPPDNFSPNDWNVLEVAPGGFVIERGVLAEHIPMPVIEAVLEGVTAAETSKLAEESPVSELVETISEVPEVVEPTSLPSDEQLPTAGRVSLAGPTVGVVMPAVVVPTPAVEPPPPAEPTIAAPPYVLPPAEAYAGQELRMITVILRTGADKVRDNLRLRQCYGILISYSGHDRFALQIFERSRGYRIEFPNYTTAHSAELIARLASIVGADNILVEPLRLH
jgi:DNA polymerase-3 subunit alpha